MPAAEGISTGVNFFFNSAKAVESSQRLTGSMGGLDSAIKKVGAAAATYLTFRGVAGAVRGVIQSGAGAEVQLTKLETSLGDSALAFEKYTKAIDVANRTPFETDQVITSVVKLSAYGVDAFEEVGKTGQDVFTTVGNMAGSMGKSIDNATEAIADALTGEMERMKEFGISVHTLPPEIKALERGSAKWREEIIKYIATVPRFAGGMEKMSKTFTGLMSTIRGLLGEWVKTISGFGDAALGGAKTVGSFFSDVKKAAEGFIKWWLENIKVITNLARAIGQGLRLVWAVLKGVFSLIGRMINVVIKRFEVWWGTFGKGDEALRVFMTKITVATIGIEAFFERVWETVSKHSGLITSAFYAIITIISMRLIPSILLLTKTLAVNLVKGGFFFALMAAIDLIRSWDNLTTWAKTLRFGVIALGTALFVFSKWKKIVQIVKLAAFIFRGFAYIFTKSLLPALKLIGTTLIRTVIPAVWSFTAALLANPITWIVLAIAGLTAGIIALVKYWPEVKAFGASLIKWFQDAAKGFATWVSDLWDSIIRGVKELVYDTINFFIKQYNKLAGLVGMKEIPLLIVDEKVRAAETPGAERAVSPEAERTLTRPAQTTTVTHKSSANITINESGNARETAAYVVNFLDRRYASGGAY